MVSGVVGVVDLTYGSAAGPVTRVVIDEQLRPVTGTRVSEMGINRRDVAVALPLVSSESCGEFSIGEAAGGVYTATANSVTI